MTEGDSNRTTGKMSLSRSVFLWLSCAVLAVRCDIYFHNPRGSNNRLDEATRPRTNAKRMFNSQNNDRGGYNVGSLFYYQGSVLPVEWTNQHSCDSANSHCELVLQYMCHNQLRDGVTTKTIPEEPAQCDNNDCNTDRKYGMNENYDYYANCRQRQRNKGLFTADQNLTPRNRQFAKNTRQNPAGTRYAYECSEERDYYPYWHPTPWKDIAIMTNNVSRCMFYRMESENVRSRWACVVPSATLKQNRDLVIPNTRQDCESFRWPANDPNGVRAEWKEFPAHGLPAPDCRETQFTRDNHLGNGLGGHPNLYNWTIPSISHERCVLRIRYNVSTEDYDGWGTDYTSNGNPTKIKMADKYGFSDESVAGQRGYKFKNNPEIKMFEDANFGLRLAVNTAQYGRVFQDRSHTFAVRQRPANLEGSTIHNLNVRGKRGNIVQVYPAVEYDFVPNTMEIGAGDYVHIQWTGSNTNPRNNDGNGLPGSDRNNIVLLNAQQYPEGRGASFGPGNKLGHYGLNYPMHVNNGTFLGLSPDDVHSIGYMSPGQYGGEMSQLDDAGTYFNLEPREITQVGTYHYMSTRNNDFSNRDQKARVMVYSHPIKYEAIGWMGGKVALDSGLASVQVEQGVFDQLRVLRLEQWSREEGERQLQAAHRTMALGDDYASDFLVIYPQDEMTTEGRTFSVEMMIKGGNNVAIYRSNSDNFATWTQVDADIEGETARFKTREGGVFVARNSRNVGLIVGIAIACIVVVAIIVGAIVYFRRHPKKWELVKTNCHKAKLSTQNKV